MAWDPGDSGRTDCRCSTGGAGARSEHRPAATCGLHLRYARPVLAQRRSTRQQVFRRAAVMDHASSTDFSFCFRVQSCFLELFRLLKKK